MKRLVIVLVVLVVAMAFIRMNVDNSSSGGEGHDEEQATEQMPPQNAAPPLLKPVEMKPDPKTMELKGKVISTPSGLKYADIKVGHGQSPTPADTVVVKYTGRFVNGEVFDSTEKHGGEPSKFGVTKVIPGWTEALLSMKPGGKRKVIIPPAIGYGDSGSPPQIPPKATLVFDIELVGVEKTPAQ